MDLFCYLFGILRFYYDFCCITNSNNNNMRSKFKWIFSLLLALSMQFVFAQEKTVSGTVTDETGALPGVNVVVSGTKNGTQTGFDGKYSIKAKQGDVLVFSFLGMDTMRMTVTASSVVDVNMKGTVKLEEVVVLGYGRSKGKNEITGNVVKLSSTDLQKSTFVSVEQAMQGKVAGLTISGASGTPGSVQDVRIRGIQSINASNSPLYVIDGVPVISGDLSGSTSISSMSVLATLSSSDIESMTVLKDAAATSVYGARGTNGVIIITTKKGKAGETKYSFNTGVGFMNNSSKGLTPTSGVQKEALIYEAVRNTFKVAPGSELAFMKTNASTFGSTYAQLNAWINDGRKVNNWTDELERKDALIRDYSLSVNTGNEKNKVYASLSYNKTENTVIGSDFRRINGIVNINSQLSDKLNLSISLNGSNVTQNGVLEGGAFFSNPNLSRYFMSPWISPYNADGSLNLTMANTSLHNTVFTANENVRKNDVLRALQNTKLEYSIFKNLKFTSVLGIDYIVTNYKSYNSPLNGDGAPVGGYVEESIDRNFNYVAQNSLDYNFTINEDHRFSAKALLEFQKNKRNYLYGYGENLPNEIFQNLNNTSANEDAAGFYEDWSSRSYLGLLNYDYKGKYLVDVSYRYEGNSRFSEDTRFGSFYSVGLAWNLHKESFISDALPFFSTLRLRGSHGVSGNAGIGLNQYQALLSFDGSYGQNPGSYPSVFGNTVGWELAQKNDVGLEFGVFDNRLNGSVAYFSNKTYDMLLSIPLSPSSGFDSTLGNVGEMTNKGFEVELSADIVKNENFTWNLSGNFTKLKNEVTSMPEAVPFIQGVSTRIEEGHSVNEWYMQKWAGVDPATGDGLWYIDGVGGATTNDYAKAQRAYQGENSLPTMTIGLSNSFTYKGFFVNGSIYFAGGNKIYEDWAGYTHATRGNRFGIYNTTTEVLDRWQKPGDIATHPRMEWSNTNINTSVNTSTRFLYDGEFARLRDVAFGYTFNKKQLTGSGLESLQLTMRGNNLLTWVKDDRLKYDPEVRADGFTRLATPPTKSIMFQLNVNF